MGSNVRVTTCATVFSGVEGSGQGLEAAGLRQLWACERDKYAASVLRFRYSGLPIYDDVSTLPVADLEAPYILWGSPPCQDLSIAGKRKGLEGSRSGLFYGFIKIASDLVRRGTRFVFMEQVPGLLSSNGGEDFRSVLSEFLEIGATDVAWRVLDSQYFGVAQRRRRMFFAVDFGGECAAEILALAESLRGHPAPIREKGQVAPTLFASGAGTSRTASCATESEFLIPEVSHSLLSGEAGPRGADVETCIPEFSKTLMASDKTKYDPEFESYIPEPVMVRWASEGGETIQPIAQGMRVSEAATDALRSSNSGQAAVLHFHRVRRLTPRECERLQGFPDDWTRWGKTEDGQVVEISDAQRYKMCGNAVTSTVPKWMAQNLIRQVGGVA